MSWKGLSQFLDGELPPYSLEQVQMLRLTNSGIAQTAAISPDGKYVAHVRDEAGTQGLWVRQVATASDVSIVPGADVSYRWVRVSPDGNYVFYVVWDRTKRSPELWQVPFSETLELHERSSTMYRAFRRCRRTASALQ